MLPSRMRTPVRAGHHGLGFHLLLVKHFVSIAEKIAIRSGKIFLDVRLKNRKYRNLPGRISLGVRLKLYYNAQYLQIKS